MLDKIKDKVKGKVKDKGRSRIAPETSLIFVRDQFSSTAAFSCARISSGMVPSRI